MFLSLSLAFAAVVAAQTLPCQKGSDCIPLGHIAQSQDQCETGTVLSVTQLSLNPPQAHQRCVKILSPGGLHCNVVKEVEQNRVAPVYLCPQGYECRQPQVDLAIAGTQCAIRHDKGQCLQSCPSESYASAIKNGISECYNDARKKGHENHANPCCVLHHILESGCRLVSPQCNQQQLEERHAAYKANMKDAQAVASYAACFAPRQ